MKTDEKNWQSIVIAEKEKRDRESVGNVRSGDITTTVLHPHDISGINFRKALQPVVLHQLDYIDFQLGRLGDFDGDTW